MLKTNNQSNHMKIGQMEIESPFMANYNRRIFRQRLFVAAMMLLALAVGIVGVLVFGGVP